MALGDLIDSTEWRRRATFSGGPSIPYKLVDGYPKGSFEEENAEVTEQYVIEASKLLTFVWWSFSDSKCYPGTDKWSFRSARVLPQSIETTDMADIKKAMLSMVTKKITFEPYPTGRPGDPFHGEWGVVPDDTYAQYVLATITYGPGKSTEGSMVVNFNDAIEITGNASGEFISPSSNMKMDWRNNANVVIGPSKEANVTLAQVVPGIEWVVKFKRVPADKINAITAMLVGFLGKVNSKPMVFLNNAVAETVLFMGFNWNRAFSWRDTTPFYELELKFIERHILYVYYTPPEGGLGAMYDYAYAGWNHFPHPEFHTWYYLTDTAGNRCYKEEDLNLNIFGGFPEV